MKKKLLQFFVLALCICGIIFLEMANSSSPQKTANAFLHQLYATNNPEDYQQFAQVMAQSSPTNEAAAVEAVFAPWTEPMQSLAAPKLLDEIIASRLLLFFDQAAFEHSCTFHLQNVTLSSTYISTDTMQYQYRLGVQANYQSGKASSILCTGIITLQRQDEGQWLVTAIEPWNSSDFLAQLS